MTKHGGGRTAQFLVGGLVLVLAGGLFAAAAWIHQRASVPVEVVAGPWSLKEAHREETGQQRSSRVVFFDGGKKLAVMCPRYNHLLMYRVANDGKLEPAAEIALRGRPVGLAASAREVLVLQRPPGDDKHLEPGWCDRFDLDGKPVGARIASGYYPDDLAVAGNGRLLLVLSSGRAEGDARKPPPRLDVYSSDELARTAAPVPIGRLDLEPDDDVERLTISASGHWALASSPRAREALAIDLARPEAPRLAGRSKLSKATGPYVSHSPDGDWIVMPTLLESEAVVLPGSGKGAAAPASVPDADYLVSTRPEESVLQLEQLRPQVTIGRFPLSGPLRLGSARPAGLAACSDRGLLAVTTKSGTIHVIRVQSRVKIDETLSPDQVAARAGTLR